MKKLLVVAAIALVAAAVPATAIEKGVWVGKIGLHNVDPKSDNGSLAGGALDVEVGSSVRPTVMFEYFVADNLGIEVLAAWPFEHDIDLNGLAAGSTQQLPPTVSLQYHFNGDAQVSPYAGIGVNYTLFFSEDASGPIAGADLDLDASLGYALHAGVDFKVNDRWWIGVDARYIDIDTDVKVNGADVGTVEIDPIAYGVYGQFRF
jgi:outer membrane protein